MYLHQWTQWVISLSVSEKLQTELILRIENAHYQNNNNNNNNNNHNINNNNNNNNKNNDNSNNKRKVQNAKNK